MQFPERMRFASDSCLPPFPQKTEANIDLCGADALRFRLLFAPISAEMSDQGQRTLLFGKGIPQLLAPWHSFISI